MNILYGISVIALCTSFFYSAEGQATCALAWDTGTALSDSDWSWGIALDAIDDVTPAGTVILTLTATNINVIRSSTSSESESGYDFMESVLEDGLFTLTLTDYFTQYEELETSTLMRMTVIFGCTTNNRSLEITQQITDTNNHYPEFQNSPYIYELPIPLPSGFSVQLFGEISARDSDLTNTHISFTLNSTDPNASGFSASWLSQDTTDTKLHYAQLLTTTLLSIEQDITFQIFATDNGVPALTSETDITITVDEENSTPPSPVFNHHVYIADHSDLTIEEASGTLITFNQGNVGLSEGFDDTVEYTIEDNIGSYANNFGITISEDYSYITMTLQDVTEELLAENYVILTLTATRSGATYTGVTILHIDLPGILSCTMTTESVASTDETTTQYSTIDPAATTITDSYTECPTITTEACTCDYSTTPSADGDSTTATTVTGNEGTTTSSDSDDNNGTTEDDTVTSSSDGDSTTATTVIGNESTTTSSGDTTECPVVTVTQECYCSTTELDNTASTTSSDSDNSDTTTVTPTLSFSSSVYRFDVDSTFTGILMMQTAVATNAEGTIAYSATIDDEDLASRIIIDSTTAELKVTAAISPGIYTFQITATIEELSLSTSATVVLVISTLTECSGDIVFGYALQIIELDEELAHENILPLDDNGCSYTIYSQTPNQGLFSITDNYLNTVAIDREATYFSEMTVAQVRVTIDASCPNETETATETTRSKRNTEYEVLAENIAYERTRTVLVVIINDINDNPPVWSSDTPIYVGFPSYDLAQLIHVPSVYQFLATDADIGDNADVTYNLPSGSDEVFYIHNTEGSLYIQKEVYAGDNSQLTIIATDGVFETPTELTVRTLESSNVVVLFVTGGVLEDADSIVEELSTNTGYWISSLGAAVVSERDASISKSLRSVSRRSKRATDANTLLRLVIYGLENNEPVTSETLVSELEAADFNWTISDSATLESILSDNTSGSTETDTRGYWAAIIVLSLLLFLLIIGTAIVYWLFCRPKTATSIESDISYENFENRPSNGSTGKHFAKSVTLGESQDDALSPNPSKRKSVAFNTTVEEIEDVRL